MSTLLPFLLVFIIALAIGVFVGKLLFSARFQSEKISLEEKLILKTITSDNGKEFAQHQEIARELDIDYYFVRSYHSWERGANENLNGLIRQYFPKGISFENSTKEQVQMVEDKLNNKPRKRFGFKTPNQVYLHK